MIGIISDTHDNIPNIKKAVDIFKNRKVDLVIHLGDLVAPVTALYFKGLKMKFIKGNCDGDVELMKERIKEIGGEFLGISSELNLSNKKLFLIHKPDNINELALSGKYDYILHGHDHKAKDEKIGKTRIINPGTHYLGNPIHTIALLDLEKDNVEFIEIK
ncbi:MAG: metallophosphoesterase [Candidatus Woesearchaeota archaeon]|nr:metallophosphoesterase [Candidatus Woesearchaeota archaeon]